MAASDLSTANAFSFTLLGDEDGKTTTVSLTYQDILDGATFSTLADKINASAAADEVDITAEYNTETGAFSLSGSGEGSSDKLRQIIRLPKIMWVRTPSDCLTDWE